MLVSTLTSKGQATIPAEVRHALGLKPGNKLTFIISGHTVVVSKAKSHDYLYHAATSNALGEWDSAEDDEAYRDL